MMIIDPSVPRCSSSHLVPSGLSDPALSRRAVHDVAPPRLTNRQAPSGARGLWRARGLPSAIHARLAAIT